LGKRKPDALARLLKVFLGAFSIVVLLVPMLLLSCCAAPAQVSALRDIPDEAEAKDFVPPVIRPVETIDRDLDGIQDSFERMVSEKVVNDGAALPVIVTLHNPVRKQDLDLFVALGGRVTHVYRYVTYGFAGVIPVVNLSRFASHEKENLCIVEYDKPVIYHLDVSAPLVRARPIVWNTYGYAGSPNHSIAIIDSGIDDTHPDVGPYEDLDFSRKLVGWYDATSDMAATPEDYCEHGTHCAGIAAGTGTANSLQGSGKVETTFALELPPEAVGPRVYGYVDYIDVMNPGVIELNCSWSGGNNVWLILSDPAGDRVKDVSGASSPLILTYTTVGTAYPTGRYEVFVGNIEGPSGTPFSCAEVYPYGGRNDGYNLFTGVAPQSKLVGVKVFDNAGSASTSTVIGGMEWVVANKYTYNITVASMSIGIEEGGVDTTLDQKVDTMVENGVVTCVSAGNDYPDYSIGSPGTAAYAITVAATNDENGITSYSSNGDAAKNEYGLVKPDVAAPGGSVNVGNRIIAADSNDVDYEYSGQSDYAPDDYQQFAGTSMSTPQVAGLAALMIDALSSWSWTKDEAFKVKMLLGMTSFETQSGEGSNVPLLDRGEKDSREGYGRICADAAIEAVAMNYSVGEVADETLGSNPADKKVWARQVSLVAQRKYEFNLSVPQGADYDLYLYDGHPDEYGQPVILEKSTDASVGADETIYFTPGDSGRYYVVVKWVSGSGPFNLHSGIVHDVAVVGVTSSAAKVYAGSFVDVKVRVRNEGGATETFNVTAFYDTNVIGKRTVVEIEPGAEEEVTFSWNTTDVTPYIDYTIKAEATRVAGETNMANNVYDDGIITIKMLGDVDGDGDVDIEDLSWIARAWGTTPAWPHGTDWHQWNPECDINHDEKVDAYDLSIAGEHYGQIW
jgi:subtilisin family serine protease